MCYFNAYSINAKFAKKYTEVLGKGSGEELQCQSQTAGLVQELTQRHQTAVVCLRQQLLVTAPVVATI